MAADSVGQIGLDLVINKNGFDKQLVGIQSLAKKTGKILAAAFTVKKLADFGKECIELGSDPGRSSECGGCSIPTYE